MDYLKRIPEFEDLHMLDVFDATVRLLLEEAEKKHHPLIARGMVCRFKHKAVVRWAQGMGYYKPDCRTPATEILDKMKDRFDERLDTFQVVKRLLELKPFEKETLPRFVDRLRFLKAQARDETQIPEAQLVRHVISFLDHAFVPKDIMEDTEQLLGHVAEVVERTGITEVWKSDFHNSAWNTQKQRKYGGRRRDVPPAGSSIKDGKRPLREVFGISEEEYQRRRRDDVCLRCGKGGHKARDCRAAGSDIKREEAGAARQGVKESFHKTHNRSGYDLRSRDKREHKAHAVVYEESETVQCNTIGVKDMPREREMNDREFVHICALCSSDMKKTVEVNGKTCKALVDTGTEKTLVKKRLLRDGATRRVRVKTVGGVVEREVHELDCLKVGPSTHLHIQVVAMEEDDAKVDVILGLDVMRDVAEMESMHSATMGAIEEMYKQSEDKIREMNMKAIRSYWAVQEELEKERTMRPRVLETYVSEDGQKLEQDLLEDYPDLFIEDDSQISRMKVPDQHIRFDWEKMRKIKVKHFRVTNPQKRAVLEEKINKRKEAGRLRAGVSRVASPAVVMPKGDKGWRVVYDYREVNECIYKDSYPAKDMNFVKDQMAGKRVLGILDMKSAFEQLPIDEETSEGLAITAGGEVLIPDTLTMGTAVSTQLFQRVMDTIVLKGIPDTHCTVDDIVFGSDTIEEFTMLARTILDRLRKYHIKLGRKKAKLFRARMKVLGRIIGDGTVAVDPAYVEAVRRLEVPRTVKKLRKFIGMIRWLQGYIRGGVSMELQQLSQYITEDSKEVIVDDSYEQLVQKVKDMLLETVEHTVVREGDELHLYTDASLKGMGAVLLVVRQDGSKGIAGLWERALNKAEQNYIIAELETKCFKMAVDNFSDVLLAVPKFMAHVDSSVLTYLADTKKPLHKLHKLYRWLADLSTYSYEMVHISGEDNPVADYLSRYTRQHMEDAVSYLVEPYEYMDLLGEEGGMTSTPAQRQRQNKRVWRALKYYRTHEGTIQWKSLDGWLDVPKPEERETIIKNVHEELGHGGINACIHHIRHKRKLHWPGMNRQAAYVLAKCRACLEDGKGTKVCYNIPMDLPKGLMEVVSLDFIGPLPEDEDGNKYILSMYAPNGNWPEVAKLPVREMYLAANAFEEVWIHRLPIPKVLITDNEFDNEAFKTLCEDYGIEHRLTSPYNPSANGDCERFNGTLQSTMRKYINSEGGNIHRWNEELSRSVYAIRHRKSDALSGYTPYELLFGEDRDEARTELVERRSRKESHTPFIDLQKDDIVYILHHIKPRKMTNKATGPYRVLQVGKRTVVVEDKEGSVQSVHTRRIIKTTMTVDEFNLSTTNTDNRDYYEGLEEEEEEMYSDGEELVDKVAYRMKNMGKAKRKA